MRRGFEIALVALLVTSLWAGKGWAEAPVPGLGVLCVSASPAAGEAAARDLAVKSLGAKEVRAEGTLTLPADLKALWWHSESLPTPAALRSAAGQRALLDWLSAGHGLFLSGTALLYLTELGLEPTAPRSLFPGGNDQVTAGVAPGANAKHPAYAGFEEGQPVLLASAGFPCSADFWGSGGPKSGALIGGAYPDSGENPFVEYSVGKGRVVALGWRLPYYALAGNTYRANLERLTANVLRYLAAGRWYGKIGDSRLNALWARLERVNADAVRRAVTDLTTTFPDRYKRGPEYLKLLDELVQVKADFQKDDSAADRAQALLAKLDQALLDNPLLDFDKVLLVARSEANLGLPANWDSNSSISPTGYDNELTVLSPVRPDGKLTTVYRPASGRFIGDVDLDFSGDRVLFSMPNDQNRWRVSEMDLQAGKPTELPLIPDGDLDNYDACYLSDGNVIFTSTAPFVGVPCVTGSSHVSNTYRWDRATGAIRQLTFEQDHDWCPTVMNDGRLMYLRWEYTDLPHFVSRILFAMNPDGTGQMALYKSNSYWPNSMFYARPIPNDPSKFVAIVVGHHDGTRMGELVLFDAARGRYEAAGAVQRIPGFGKKIEPVIRDGLTGGSWPKFLHPYPLSDKYFLVSCKPTPGSRWGLYLVDVFDNMTLIKESDTHALLEPLPLRATPRPPVIAPKVDLARKDATVFVSDIYQGKGLAGVPRGTVKQLRLFTYQFAYHGMGGQVNRVGLDGPWDVKRIIGTVPVEADGSAYFRMPADTPISVQPLDEKGQALQLMRSWMTAMPGEALSCVGCHEQRSTVPPEAARRARALAQAPRQITPWYGPTRGFSFVREVQPVLDRRCIACHNGSSAAQTKGLPDFRNAPMVNPPGPDNGYQQGSHFSPSYLALKRFVRNATIESDMHLLMPGEFAADTTALMQMLRKGHHGVQLSAEDWDRLTTWIDLNAPAHGTWHEIVGEGAVNHYRDRRRDIFKRYGGKDEDPEEIFPVSYHGGDLAPGPAPRAGARDATTASAVPGWPFDAAEAKRRQAADGASSRTVDLGEGMKLELVHVPAGEFVMGDATGCADEKPATRARVEKPFWMGRLEVTNAQFARFDPTHDSRLEEGDYLQFGVEERGYPVNAPEQPVLRVSWRQAMAFCRWLSQKTGQRFTLPTEAQWEWACRAGTAGPFWYGDANTDFARFANLADISLKRVDTFAPWGLPSGAIYEWRPAADKVDDGFRVSAPAGHYQPNPWGLCDMIGNAAEWTRSAYRPYPYREAPQADAADTGEKTVRGGSWYAPPNRARSGFRQAYPTYRGVFDVGFRVICTL